MRLRVLTERVGRALRVLVALLMLGAVGAVVAGIAYLRGDEFAARVRAELSARAAAVGLRVDYTALRVSLVPPGVTLSGLAVRTPGQPAFLRVERARAQLDVLGLPARELRISEIRLERPRIAMRFDEAMRPADLPSALREALGLDGASPTDAPAEADAPLPLRLVVERVRVEGAHVIAATDSGFFVDLADVTAAFFNSGGLYSIDARLRGGLLQSPELSQDLRELRLEGALRPPTVDADGALTIAALRVETNEITLEARGRVTSGPADGLGAALAAGGLAALATDGLDVELSAPVDLVERLFPDDAPHLEGQLSAELRITGLLARPRAAGHLRVVGAVADTFGIGDLDVELDADPTRLRVEQLTLTQPAARATLSATLTFDEHLSLTVAGRAEDVAFAPLLDVLRGPASIVVFDGGADFELSGALRGPEGFALTGHAVARVRDFGVRYDYWRIAPPTPNIIDFDAGTVTTGLRIDPDGIHYLDALIEVGQSRLRVNGTMGYPPDGSLDLHAVSESFDLADLGLLVGLEVAGRGQLTANVVGPYSPSIHISGALDLRDMRFAGHPLGHATARIDERDGRIEFSDVVARLRGSVAEAYGVVDVNTQPVSVDWTLVRAHGRIEDAMAMLGPLQPVLVPASLQGSTGELLTAEGTIAGDVSRVGSELHLELGASHVPSFDQHLDGATLDLVAPLAGGVELLPSTVRRGTGVVSFSGTVDPSGRMRLTGSSVGLRLEHIDSIATTALAPAGDAALEFDWHGRTTHPEVQAHLALEATTLGGVPLGDSLAQLTLDGEQLRLTGPLLGGALQIEAGALFRGEYPYFLTVELASTDLHRIAPGDPTARAWRATATGTVEAKGLLRRVQATSADVRLSALVVSPGPPGLTFTNEGPVRLHVDGDGFDIGQLLLVAPRARLAVSGGRASGGELDLGLSGRLDAGVLPGVWPWITAVEGAFDVDARIAGTPESPLVLGSARMQLNRLRLKHFAQPIADVRGVLGFGTGSVSFNDVEGRIGDGRLTLDGDVGLPGARTEPDGTPSGLRWRLRAALSRVRLAMPEEIPSIVSGDLQVLSEPGERLPVLTGLLRIDEARYTRNLSLLDRALDSFRRRPMTPSVLDPERELLRFDVALRADRTMRVRNNRMDIDLSGDLRLTGTNQRIGLVGVVEAVRGRVEERDHVYTLRRGRVEFTDPTAVRFAFDVVAETVLRGTVADTTRASETSFFGAPRNSSDESACKLVVTIAGTADAYETHFASPDCAYSEEELKHWLATGSPREADPLHALSNVGIDVLMDVSGIDRELRRLVPGARLRVSNVFRRNARSNADTVTQVALEWQATERLRLEFATALTQEEPDQRLRVEARLGRVSSLQLQALNGGPSQVADFGLDLKLRWEY